MAEVCERIVAFKRPVYEKVVAQFARLAETAKG